MLNRHQLFKLHHQWQSTAQLPSQVRAVVPLFLGKLQQTPPLASTISSTNTILCRKNNLTNCYQNHELPAGCNCEYYWSSRFKGQKGLLNTEEMYIYAHFPAWEEPRKAKESVCGEDSRWDWPLYIFPGGYLSPSVQLQPGHLFPISSAIFLLCYLAIYNL
jgi:hypothetical protein